MPVMRKSMPKPLNLPRALRICSHTWKHFGRIVGAFDAERDKPDPAPVDMALAPGGIARGPDVWFVGDADIDLTCGINAGCVPVLVRPEAPSVGEFPLHPPTHHFVSCAQLCNFLQTM